MIKLAICIPAYGDTKAKFTLSLAQALIHLGNCRMTDPDGNLLEIETEIFMVSCSMLTESRHRLAAEAIVWGASHMLWLDADHVFPADAIPRLLAHNRDVIGANYARRCTPTAPTASRKVTDADGQDYKNLVYTTLEKATDGVIEEVDHLGFGLCMMNMRVFDLLQAKADKETGSFMPLFKFEEIPGQSGMIGEDVYFFRKLREAGAKIYVDHELSWETGHIHEYIYTNAHAVKQQDKWIEAGKKLTGRFEDKIKQLEEAA
jgi:hypothetical protein